MLLTTTPTSRSPSSVVKALESSLDNHGNTVMDVALLCGQAAIVALLRQRQLFATACNARGDTALHTAARVNNVVCAKVRWRERRRGLLLLITPLQLLSNEAVNVKNIAGDAPLHVAGVFQETDDSRSNLILELSSLARSCGVCGAPAGQWRRSGGDQQQWLHGTGLRHSRRPPALH